MLAFVQPIVGMPRIGASLKRMRAGYVGCDSERTGPPAALSSGVRHEATFYRKGVRAGEDEPALRRQWHVACEVVGTK